MEDEKEKKEEKAYVETRTIEVMLRELREEKSWSYYNVIEELNKLGVEVDLKKIKKWEVGLEYPDLDTIYKLSELYMIPSKDFITAKSNSYAEGYNSIHMTFIKWFCYITGFTLKVGYIFFYVALALALIMSFLYFISQLKLVDKDLI